MGVKEDIYSFSLDELLDEAKQYQTEETVALFDSDEALDSLLKELHSEKPPEKFYENKINDYIDESFSAEETEIFTEETDVKEDDLNGNEFVEEIIEERYPQEEDIDDTPEDSDEEDEFIDDTYEETAEEAKRIDDVYDEAEYPDDVYTDEDVIYPIDSDVPKESDGNDESKIADFIQRLEQSNEIEEAQNEYIEAIESERELRRKEKNKKAQREKHDFLSFFSFKTNDNVTSCMAGNCKTAEYEDVSQSKEISSKISRDVDFMQICTGIVCAMAVLSVLAGAIPQAIASMVDIETALSAFGGSAMFYMVSNFVLLLCSCIFGYPVIVNGFRSLIKGSCCADTGVTIALVLCLIQNLLFLFTDSLANENIRLMSSAAVFSLFLLMAARLLHLRQLQEHFEFCTAKEPLYNAMHISNKRDSAEIGKGLMAGEPNLRYSTQVKFPSHFFETVLGPLPCDKTMRHLFPPALLASVVTGIITWIISRSFLTGFTALTAMVCLSVPAAVTLADILPFVIANNSLSKVKAGIPSCGAAVKCAETDGVIFDADEIFKNGGKVSPNFKPFKMNRIDEALLNAASLTSAVDGPLAESFRSMIISNHSVLPIVKDAHYVDALGIEGKVNGQSVLFGSRELMEQRGITMPSLKEERPYKRDGRRLLYLTQSGQLTAMFVVTYQANRTAGACMRRLAKDGVTIFVRSDDPGITESFVEEVFHLPQNSVKILRGDAGALYRNRYEKRSCDAADISVMHRGRLKSFLLGINSCFALQKSFDTSRLIEQIGIGIGIAVFALLSFTSPNLAGASQILLYQIVFAAVNLLLPLKKKK